MKKPPSKIKAEIARLHEQLKQAETREAERIGRLALKAGLGEIEIDEAVLLAAFHFLIADQIAPRSERAFVTWWNSTTEPGEEPEAPKPIWFRLGTAVVGISIAAGIAQA